MKSLKDIYKFLRKNKPIKSDEEAIKNFCKDIYVDFKFFFESQCIYKIEHLSFSDFKKWFIEYPSEGEVIYIKDINGVGIIESIEFGKFLFAAILLKSGNFILDYEMTKLEFRKAKEDEIHLLQKALNANQLSWSFTQNKIVKKIIKPEPNNLVSIIKSGVKIGFGVFKEIDKAENAIFYLVKFHDKPLRYSTHENIGPVNDFQFNRITIQERSIFNEVLSSYRVVWDGFRNRVVPIKFRVDKGDTYFYVNEYLEIVETKDLFRKNDDKRFSVCNYFLSERSAKVFIKKIISERNSLLINQALSKNKNSKKNFSNSI